MTGDPVQTSQHAKRPATTAFVPRPPRIFLHTLCRVEVSRSAPSPTSPPGTTTEAGVLLVLSTTGGIVGIPRTRLDAFAPDDAMTIHLPGADALSLPAVVSRQGVEEPLWGLHVPFRFEPLPAATKKRLEHVLQNHPCQSAQTLPSTPRRSTRRKRIRRLRLYLLAVSIGVLLLLALHAITTALRAPLPSAPTQRITIRDDSPHAIHSAERPGHPHDPLLETLSRHPEAETLRHSTYETLTPDQRAWLHQTFTTEELEQIRTLRGE